MIHRFDCTGRWIPAMPDLLISAHYHFVGLRSADNPPPPAGMQAFVTALIEQDVTAQAIDAIARRKPARLLGLE